jgi:DNA-binding MarR family transcriptional regulator/GNAT superfamily N-acetyltransferase
MLAKSNHLRDAVGMTTPADRVAALRAFTRFYTRHAGVLGETLLSTRFSLPESRLLWELSHSPGVTAAALGRELGLDTGYLSRLLAGLRERGLVKAQRSASDARQTLLSLTAAGRRAFAPLDRRSHEQVSGWLSPLNDDQQRELLAAAGRMRALLGAPPSPSPIELRGLRPGDIGWVIARHGALYAQEYGWDQRFEALVARIAADFVDRFDDQREAAWIAEREGVPLGCVFLVQARDDNTGAPEAGVAQLRLLLVEPMARGLGLGKHLTAECERFARAAGYRRIRLWTNQVLAAARGIYGAAGYQLLASEPHESFGHHLVGEIWELELK